MEEQLISFETALLAKEKVFDLKVVKCYDEKGNIMSTYDLNNIGCEGGLDYEDFYADYNNQPNLENHFESKLFSAPIQSLLQKWLREKHKLHIDVSYLDDVYCFYYKITEIKTNTESDVSKGFKTYEEALEEGLKEALNKI